LRLVLKANDYNSKFENLPFFKQCTITLETKQGQKEFAGGFYNCMTQCFAYTPCFVAKCKWNVLIQSGSNTN